MLSAGGGHGVGVDRVGWPARRARMRSTSPPWVTPRRAHCGDGGWSRSRWLMARDWDRRGGPARFRPEVNLDSGLLAGETDSRD